RADPDAVVLRADHDLEPDAGFLVQSDIADEGRVVCHVMARAEKLDAPRAEGEKRHAAIISRCVRASPAISTCVACAITCAAGRRRARPRWCCCTAGWTCR